MFDRVGGSSSAAGQYQSSQHQAQLQRLGTAIKRDPSRLIWGSEDRISLLDGTELLRIKALDRSTAEIVGASFKDGVAVDEAALRADIGARWRATHGAITPGLLAK